MEEDKEKNRTAEEEIAKKKWDVEENKWKSIG